MRLPILLFIFFLLSLPAVGQNVYLRTPSAGGSFTLTACTNATPIVCTTSAAHGFSAGQVIAVYNVWGNWSANGLRKVASSPAPTTFTFGLTDINNTNVAGAGTFCDPPGGAGVCSSYQSGANYRWIHGTHATVSALGTFTLKAHPRVWLDGPGGALTTAVTDTTSTGRANSNNVPWQAVLADVGQMETGNAYQTIFGPTTGIVANNIGKFLSTAWHWNALGGSKELGVARWIIDNIPQMAGGTFGCNNTVSQSCDRVYDVDGMAYTMDNLAQLYSLLHGQLSSTEISNFANAVLNGQAPAADGWDPKGCTNQWTGVGTGTLSTSGSSTTITISGGTTLQLAVGNILMLRNQEIFLPVSTIVDSTHFTTSLAVNISSPSSFDINTAWTSSSCGMLWLYQFYNESIFSDPYNYPTGGGVSFFGEANITLLYDYSMIMMGLALADDDPRAVDLLAMSYAYYYDNMFGPIEKNMWTGFNQSRPDYMGNTAAEAEEIAIAITNSVDGYSPSLTSGTYLQRLNAFSYYTALPQNTGLNTTCYSRTSGGTANCAAWFGDLRQPIWLTTYDPTFFFSTYLYSSTPEAQYANWWLQQQAGLWTASDLRFGGSSLVGSAFVFVDPAATQKNLSGAPHQYLFRDTDYASCASLGFTCPSYKQYGNIVSRTGLTSPNDTFALLYVPDFYSDDHTNGGEAGELQIVKGTYLLGGDNPSNQAQDADGMGTSESPEFNNALSSYRSGGVDFFDANILRWAGTDPTGDPSNNYTYAMVDLVCNYSVGAINGCPPANTPTLNLTRVQQHFLHFKKSGAPDYILEYYDWAASSPGALMRTYLHYALNYSNAMCNPSSPGEGVTFSGGSNGGTVTSNQTTGTLLTDILIPAGTGNVYTYVDNANGTYTGGNGCTFRVSMCAGNGSCNSSATAFEAVAIHEPLIGSGGTMPTITQLTAANFRVVQIADSTTPKVAAFAQGGSTYTAASFTTSYSGSGQTLIAGLTPGSYAVTVGGSPVTGSPFTVNANDNTLYFESTSGAVSLSANIVGTATSLNGLTPNGVTVKEEKD